MDFAWIGELVWVVLVLAVMFRHRKQDPERFRRSLAVTCLVGLAAVSPLAVVEVLSAFGVELLNVPWAIRPLDIMSGVCVLYLMVTWGKVSKLFYKEI